MGFFQFTASAIIAGSFGLTGVQTEPPVEFALDTLPSVETGSVVVPTVAANLARSNKSASMRAATGKVVLASGKPKRSKRAFTKARNGQNGLIVFLPSGTRAVPRHVYQDHRLAKKFKVPKGYSTVWQDDRLNPRRAEQSLGGYVRMNLIWTNTVPRRLIDADTGKDMTYIIPVIYPQSAPLKPSVSTRSQATQPAPQIKSEAAVGQKYVQVGTFENARGAKASARKVKKLGLPVRIGKYDQNGKTYRLVLAGPFSSDGQIEAALKKAHSAGFSDAFARN